MKKQKKIQQTSNKHLIDNGLDSEIESLFLKSIKLPLHSNEYIKCMRRIAEIECMNILGCNIDGTPVMLKKSLTDINYSISKDGF